MKELIKAVIVPILIFVYNAILGQFPDFPISQESFIDFVLWILAFIVGGFQLKSFFVRKKGR